VVEEGALLAEPETEADLDVAGLELIPTDEEIALEADAVVVKALDGDELEEGAALVDALAAEVIDDDELKEVTGLEDPEATTKP